MGGAAAGGSESESKARLLCSLFEARRFRISVAAGAKSSSSSSSSGLLEIVRVVGIFVMVFAGRTNLRMDR